ncbi:hypothetical protein [Psychroserpens damuponensis]|uniref:hypothetical protein n=1 Tax=Psychroserpens damuponensis TaxID=943936 RepID=UPI00058EE68F|nr:hypothetical protein [Psychroserpens damuponensis]
MLKLDKENIQFIDNYLENSDIFYADIRMEMTDHVASEIEQLMETEGGDFYETFKFYMVSNKSIVLENNKQFIKCADTSILKRLWIDLSKLTTLVIFSLIFFISYKWLSTIEVEGLRDYMALFPMVSIVPFCIVYVIALNIFKLPRFSGIERLAFLYMIGFQLFHFMCAFSGLYIKSKSNFYIVAIVIAVIGTLSLLIIKITLNIIRQYRKDYKCMTS